MSEQKQMSMMMQEKISDKHLIKIKLRSFNSGEYINEKGDGPYRGFGYLSLFILHEQSM